MIEPLVMRIGIILMLALISWLVIWGGRRFVETRRQRALTATPVDTLLFSSSESVGEKKQQPRIRILSFSSPDCHQCHQLQEPALLRVSEERGEEVAIVHIDAATSPELTQRYQVLTVPTTVILDARGKAHAINYGFTNAQRLLAQIDASLESVRVHL